ncbi:MAG TPA: glycosyltransferase family 39 protein [Patescibacteria group bacterium]|nr:glycosyltransferase family 39 protein [Patescibacteria group bacterium]
MAIKKSLACLIIFIFCLLFFSFRLPEVPRGMTIDEAAFGYNASLISQTLRDENGRFLPVFVLSLQGRDWRQPVAQYLQVASYKIFGRSLLNLKLVSVLAAAVSGLLIYLLAVDLKNRLLGWAALLVFITSPVILIHSHLALDNIMPVPFILVWLIGLLKFEKNRSVKFLVLSAISLGIGFYAHKSMRSAAPVWTLATAGYLTFTQIKDWRIFSLKNYRLPVLFLISIAPFYLISPVLDYKYAGAVYGTQNLSTNSIYDFFYFYISNFDLSFLFIKGDTILHHSTGRHGMFLLITLPVFIYGLFKSFSLKNKFFIFLAICFFAGPFFISFVGSIHRASRIVFLTPLFALICGLGIIELIKLTGYAFKTLTVLLLFLALFNVYDFLNYYWFRYAQDTYNIFYSPVGIDAYKKLDEVSKKENLIPLISEDLLKTSGDGGAVEDFSRSLYFTRPNKYKEGSKIIAGTAVLSRDSKKTDAEKIETGANGYFIYTAQP